MSEVAQFLLLFVTGCTAGAVNVMAGGGSTLTLPVLILLGLDAGTANGTNRVALLVQNVFATASFKRDGVAALRQSGLYALWTLPGAAAGAMVAVQFDDIWFERILGVVMVGVVLSMLLPRRVPAQHGRERPSAWIYPALLGLGFYGGFIQVGIGFLFMAAFFHLVGVDLVQTTVYKVAIILVYTLPALAIFACTGHVDWLLGLGLAAGTATGAVLAARAAVRKGEKVVRAFLILAILVMAAKMLGVF